jgi:predicted heme/steroid binding protein/uncharacterized membrane protein
MKVYTPEKLAEANGKDGSAALVAVDGNVYDVSKSKKWVAGTHMKRHEAGANLSTDINSAPHGREVLERFEMVGTFEELPRELPSGVRGKIELWLDAHPFFRRHPHPAVVHIPVGLMAVVPIFEIIALVFRSAFTEWAAFCCLIMGVLAIPAAIGTGYFTWWINYEATDSPTIRMKRRLAFVGFILGVFAIVVRAFAVADPLTLQDMFALVYVIAVLALAATVGCVGFLGGKLTFPYECD